jgi:hypothetical protein
MRGLPGKGHPLLAVFDEGTEPLSREEWRDWRAGTGLREAAGFVGESVQAPNGRPQAPLGAAGARATSPS